MNKKNAPEQQKHLPVIGVGPLYVVPAIAVTVIAIALAKWNIIPPLGAALAVPFYIGGSVIIVCGIYLWTAAVFSSRISVKIKQNTLVTDGIYAHVRNPVYSAFLFLCTGALLLCCNAYLLVLPPLFWLYLTVFIKLTEEKWLLKQYGKEFETYCKRVNRCIPSITKKKDSSFK